MVFLQEAIDEPVQVTKSGKRMYLEGIFAQANIRNKNSRVYPSHVLENEIGRYTQTHINQNRAVGELGHPDGPNINPDRICIHIKKLWREGNNFLGKSLVVNTPMGKVVEGLVGDGVRIGVSTRALASLKEEQGIKYVQDDLRLLAIDCVMDPSAPNAFVDGIMEGARYLVESYPQLAHETRQHFRTLPLSIINEREFRMHAYNSFISRLGRCYR